MTSPPQRTSEMKQEDLQTSQIDGERGPTPIASEYNLEVRNENQEVVLKEKHKNIVRFGTPDQQARRAREKREQSDRQSQDE